MVGDSTKITEIDEVQIFSWKACLFFTIFWRWKKEKQNLKFLFTFNPWLLHSFDLPSYGSEMRKI